MIHLDLFSGIGGFAIAAEQVWDNVEHIFCDNDKFCREVLKKHWPEAPIYDDIKKITGGIQADLVTGGFPCQPFSAAGKRRGTEDNRYLWPEMLRVIQLTQPTWVIAENVLGLTTWNNGMVLEQVCSDLEAAGYTVQPIIVPAAGVDAPHKRDRVWICAYTDRTEYSRRDRAFGKTYGLPSIDREGVLPGKPRGAGEDATDSSSERQQPWRSSDRSRKAEERGKGQRETKRFDIPDWGRNWIEVATRLCSVDDGLPARVGDFKLTRAGHRAAQIKAYGNAIVPQVAEEIMRAML